MDMQKTAREIGLFESAINLAKVSDSKDVILKVGASMPLPDENVGDCISKIARWLWSFRKRKYMFLVPEISLMEELGKINDSDAEIIAVIPCDLEEDARIRLINNLPKGVAVSTLHEPFFPESFFPNNGIIVITGYSAGNRAMILPDTYRLVEHYSDFLGKKAFIPYQTIEYAIRYEGWMELNKSKISNEWRLEA